MSKIKKAPRQLIAQQLLQLGLAEDGREVSALIMAGKVLVNDQPAKPGMKVSADDIIRIRAGWGITTGGRPIGPEGAENLEDICISRKNK